MSSKILALLALSTVPVITAVAQEAVAEQIIVTAHKRADVFSLFDSDTATEVNELADFQPEMFMLPTAYQRPRQLRFDVAVRF
jgi:hypothetical protein